MRTARTIAAGVVALAALNLVLSRSDQASAGLSVLTSFVQRLLDPTVAGVPDRTGVSTPPQVLPDGTPNPKNPLRDPQGRPY